MAKKEFWDQKEPSEWTEKEVKRLLTNSPWAKDAAVEFNMDGIPGGGPAAGVDLRVADLRAVEWIAACRP